MNGQDQTIRLLGVDRSGTESACEQGWGIYDNGSGQAHGSNEASIIKTMATWHINAVRIPLNEGCWLGQFTLANDPNNLAGDSPVPNEGLAYQAAIGQEVDLLHQYGIVAILALTTPDVSFPAATNNPLPMSGLPMADEQYAPVFWTSVANYFKSDPGVIFDLYGQSAINPHGLTRTAADWSCWENGCSTDWTHWLPDGTSGTTLTRWPGCSSWSTPSGPPGHPNPSCSAASSTRPTSESATRVALPLTTDGSATSPRTPTRVSSSTSTPTAAGRVASTPAGCATTTAINTPRSASR